MLNKDTLNSSYVQAAAVFAAAFAVYFNSIWNGFVYDDTEIVLGNPWIRDFSHIAEVFTTDLWAWRETGPTNFYRPIPTIILMVQYSVFGDAPWGYHLTYVLMNSAVSVTVFFVLRRLFHESGYPGAALPVAAALVFATHPVHTEVVAWNGAHEMAFSLFALLCLLSHMKGRAAWALLFFMAAAFTKETAVVIPLILLAYDFSLGGGRSLKAIAAAYIPLILAGTAYLLLRSYAIGGFAPVNHYAHLGLYDMALSATELFADYMVMLIVPVNLTPTHVFNAATTVLDYRVAFSITLLAAYVATLFATRRRSPLVFMSLALIAIPLLPVLYIPAFGRIVFAERYLYLPTAGFAVILVLCLHHLIVRLVGEKGRAGVVFMIVLLLQVSIYGAAAIKRNRVWQSNYTLWSDAVVNSPTSPVAHNNLGTEYFKLGLSKEAIVEFEAAASHDPAYKEPYYNTGTVLHKEGRTADAIAYYMKAIRLDPAYRSAYSNLGVAYAETGEYEMAVRMLVVAVRIKPDAEGHYNLGLLYLRMERTGDARSEFETALELDHRFGPAREALAEMGQGG